jgi:hypothetical protein
MRRNGVAGAWSLPLLGRAAWSLPVTPSWNPDMRIDIPQRRSTSVFAQSIDNTDKNRQSIQLSRFVGIGQVTPKVTISPDLTRRPTP